MKPTTRHPIHRIIRIFIVAYIPETGRVLHKLFQFESDFETLEIADSAHGWIDRCEEFMPDIVLIEISAGNIDGSIAAITTIRERFPSVAIITLLIYAESEYVRRVIRAGASDVLVVPIVFEELYDSIRRAYEQFRTIRKEADNSSADQ